MEVLERQLSYEEITLYRSIAEAKVNNRIQELEAEESAKGNENNWWKGIGRKILSTPSIPGTFYPGGAFNQLVDFDTLTPAEKLEFQKVFPSDSSASDPSPSSPSSSSSSYEVYPYPHTLPFSSSFSLLFLTGCETESGTTNQ